MTKTLISCLKDLDITDAAVFADCENTDEEFKAIKKNWRTKVLAEHPDKGGNTERFRITNASFEVLRDLYQQSKVKNGTYASYLIHTAKDAEATVESDIDIDELFSKYSKNANVPSWDFFAEAAEEEVPGYKVELALSNRSKCSVCKRNSEKTAVANIAATESSTELVASAPKSSSSRGKRNKSNAVVVRREDNTCIAKDDIRVGSWDKMAGTYGRWHHLECWRVPAKIQSGLTNAADEQASLRDLISMEEVLLTGLGSLDEEDQMTFVRHVIKSDHWAGNRKRKAKVAENGQGKAAKVASKSESASKAAKEKKAASVGPVAANIVPGSFKILVPGVNGALGDSFLKGKTFVITGVFPEVGGGDDDCIGVENLKSMIETFGGKVTTRFSKNSNFLLVGNNPVAKKFKDARAKSIEIVNLVRLSGLLKGHLTFDLLDKLDALGSGEFMGNSYQQATNAKVAFGDAKPVAAAPSGKKEAKMPTAFYANEIPPLESDSEPMMEDAKPAAKPSSGAAALVPRVNPASESSSTEMVPSSEGAKSKFVMPRPGQNGAIAGVFNNQTFVLTGVFPEIGGGGGLTLGKERTKKMIESFGGRVTGSVSGKTKFLLVGKEPGAAKVSQAESKMIPLVDLLALNRVIYGQSSLDDVASEPAPRITSFSAGYGGNGGNLARLKNAAEW